MLVWLGGQQGLDRRQNFRDIDLDDRPDLVEIDGIIVMDHAVAHAIDLNQGSCGTAARNSAGSCLSASPRIRI